MMRGRAGAWLAAMAVLVAGCASTVDDRAAPRSTGAAADLAPSQIAVSTVAPPETPPPCDPADITSWTAQVSVSATAADAVVRLRNDGVAWCEVDISESPLRDPRVEPDVWLHPGEWADLVLGGGEHNCGVGTVVTLAQISLNGEQRVVPTSAVQPCDWWLTAFFVGEIADEPCAAGAIDVAVTETDLVLRNSSSTPCVLGDLVGVAGADGVERDDDGVMITVLAAGDVVAYALGGPGVGSCLDGPTTLEFDAAGAIEMLSFVGCGPVALGGGRPWFAGPEGPLAGVRDAGAALELLDPF